MTQSDGHDQFVLQLIDVQGRLYAYILSLLLDKERARDVLQQTNLIMLEKEADFQPGSNFAAWAAKIAYFEVLAERRARRRNYSMFSDELLGLVADAAAISGERHDERATALKHCLRELPEEHRQIVDARYRPGGSVAAIATARNKTPGAISALLYRIRVALAECVERKMQELYPK